MSRIQDILSKAERDGTTRRTRALSDDGHVTPAMTAPSRPPQAAYEHAVQTAPAWTPAATATAIDSERPRVMSGSLDRHLVAALEPQSLAAEQYRSLRSRGITVRNSIDVLVAAFCIDRSHLLLHRDRDFEAFEVHLGLRVWQHGSASAI